MKNTVSLGLFCLAVMLWPGNANAYVGPGLGLGAVGVIAGVLLSIVLAVFAIVWYPIKRFVLNLRRKIRPDNNDQP
jgi:hypothetical protein